MFNKDTPARKVEIFIFYYITNVLDMRTCSRKRILIDVIDNPFQKLEKPVMLLCSINKGTSLKYLFSPFAAFVKDPQFDSLTWVVGCEFIRLTES